MRDELARFAVNLEMWWSHLPPLDRVRSAAQAGFSQAEIWYWPNWDVAALADACERHGLSIAQIGGWDFEPRMNEPGHHFEFREAMKRAVEVAHRLGAPRININGPYLRPGEDPTVVRAGIVSCLLEAIPVLEGTGVTLMVEPMNTRVDHPGYSLPSSESVISVCQAIESDVLGINWDLYHLQISEGDLSGHFREGLPWVAYVQIADHPGRHEPGTGEVDYGNLLADITEQGYTGPIGLECVPRDGAQQATERVLALSRDGNLH